MKSVFKNKKALCSSGKIEIIYKKKKVSPPYNSLHLLALLKDRAKQAFKPRVYKNISRNGVIRKCAVYDIWREDVSGGDPRYALDLLRKAGEIADLWGKTTISCNDLFSAQYTLWYDSNPDAIHEYAEIMSQMEVSKKKSNRYLDDIEILLKAIKRLLKDDGLKIPIYETRDGIKYLIARHHVVPIRLVKEEIKNIVHNNPDKVIEAALFEGEIYKYEDAIDLAKGSNTEHEKLIIKRVNSLNKGKRKQHVQAKCNGCESDLQLVNEQEYKAFNGHIWTVSNYICKNCGRKESKETELNTGICVFDKRRYEIEKKTKKCLKEIKKLKKKADSPSFSDDKRQKLRRRIKVELRNIFKEHEKEGYKLIKEIYNVINKRWKKTKNKKQRYFDYIELDAFGYVYRLFLNSQKNIWECIL